MRICICVRIYQSRNGLDIPSSQNFLALRYACHLHPAFRMTRSKFGLNSRQFVPITARFVVDYAISWRE